MLKTQELSPIMQAQLGIIRDSALWWTAQCAVAGVQPEDGRHGAQSAAQRRAVLRPGRGFEQLLVERNTSLRLPKLNEYGFFEEQPSRYAAPAS